MNLYDLVETQIDWVRSDLSPYVFETLIAGALIRLRLNDFPEENIATLMMGGNALELEEFPKKWRLPKPG